MLIKERSLLEFMRNPGKDKELQSPDEATVTISKDFEYMGFCNVVIAPPREWSWTYTPLVVCSKRFVDKLHSGVPRTVQKRLGAICDYFESHGIKEKSVPMGIFHALGYGNQNRHLPFGVFWVVTVPLDEVDAFLAWLERVMERLLGYACLLKDRQEEDWKIDLFCATGRGWSLHASTDAEPPEVHIKYDCLAWYNGLLMLEKKYDEQGKRLFCARNAWRQSTVAFPYCSDEYGDWNEYPLQVIKKRIELVQKIDIPHFYFSINGRKGDVVRNAREQLEHMIQINKGKRLVSELSEELEKLRNWISHAEENYGELLHFGEP